MSDFKDSLLMPKTGFEMKADLKHKEPKIQANWIENNIYAKLLVQNKLKPYFTLHDGPPYANGTLHVGHALNKSLKDFIVRYKSMNGFNSIYIPGWDTHGLPIENAIAKKDKSFDLNNDVIGKRIQCRKYALEQVEIQKQQFQRLGNVCDFKNCYLTLDESFIYDELLLFRKLIENKLIFQDFKPVYWSWSTKCALAEAEIEYENVTSPSIYVGFELEDQVQTKLLIWTTTPWTLPSNLAIAVNPNFYYSYVQLENGTTFIVASSLVEQIAKKLAWNNYKITKEIKGSTLEKTKYKHPWINRTSIVILADYVSNEDGTGLVHNAPGFGLDDFYACKNYGIDVYCPIDDGGKFNHDINDSELENVFYTKANDIIIERIKNNSALVYETKIDHSMAHDWRTHKPIMYRATKQWFINISKVNEQIINSLNNDVSSLNIKTIERIKDMISKRQEWCISRQRVWGVPIPIIFDYEHKPIYDLKLMDHILKIIKEQGVDIWFSQKVDYFIPPWMDQTQKYYKEKDIIDVWFDSGSSYNVLKQNNIPYPADIYLEGSDQFRGWFNSSSINGTIQHGHVPYKFLLQHGFILDEKGFKMSKSKGNVIDPLKICDEYGADILRLWVASSDYSTDLRFGNKILTQVAETYRKIRNTLFKYSLSNLNDFDFGQNFTDKLRPEDFYVLDQLKKLLAKITMSYDSYNFIDVIKNVNQFTTDLSQWYFDIIKDSLYCEKQNSLLRRQIQSTLFIIVKSLIIVLTPIIPHTCEEAYSFLNTPNQKESVVLETWPIFDELITIPQEINFDEINKFFEIKDTINIAIELARQNNIIKKNNEARIILDKDYKIDLHKLKIWFNVAEVIIGQKLNIENANFKKCMRCWNHYNNEQMYDDEICMRCHTVIKTTN